jgi:anaerobic magnesium-protoporphyrin IX monomethyl ester cyclase
MNVLLLSMPDSFEHTPTVAIRMPNGALASLAGNLDPHHRVAIADLVLAQASVRTTVERLMREVRPDVVGLSVMTFQRATARRIISLARSLDPAVRIVLGGYDPSLAPEAWTQPAIGVDVIVRGEGDITFRELLRAFERGTPLCDVAGIWYREGSIFRRTGPRGVARAEQGTIRPPDRSVRVLSGYTMLGRQADVVETSRGCTFDCSFCSIIEMRGRNFHRFTLDHVIADIADARARGARAIFLVDDNITIDVPRFEALCRRIIDAGFDDVDYLVQAMTSAIASHGATLVPLMKRAGMRYVFLGIENILPGELTFLNAAAKNRRRQGSDIDNAAVTAIEWLHRYGLIVVGGLIVGNPTDDAASIEANLAFARQYVDWPYIQHPTPYPGTPMTRDLVSRGLVVNPCVDEYDGTTAVVGNTHLASDDIEFMRWKAERWMKVRHLPSEIRHAPGFVLRHGLRMLAHTFRGSTWRSRLGLERPRTVFGRYRAIRAHEREYLDWPDPCPSASFDTAADDALPPAAHELTWMPVPHHDAHTSVATIRV